MVSLRLLVVACGIIGLSEGSPGSRWMRGAGKSSGTTSTPGIFSGTNLAPGSFSSTAEDATRPNGPVGVSESTYSPYHVGACPDPSSWSDVKVKCEGCTALVKHESYGSTCEGYCKGQGLQCLSAYEEVNNDCTVKSWHQCSEPILGTSDALCECILPCSQTGESCTETKCCQSPQDTCFETAFASAVCMRSCTLGVESTCRTPFEHPTSQARESWRWPDTVCVVASDEVLVRPEAFHGKYDSDCKRYCIEGAGAAVQDEVSTYWFSPSGAGAGAESTCPGGDMSEQGARCRCSLSDRL